MNTVRRYLSPLKIAELLATAVFLLGMVRFLSYFFQPETHSWFGIGRPMAFSTSICMMFLGVCLHMILYSISRD